MLKLQGGQLQTTTASVIFVLCLFTGCTICFGGSLNFKSFVGDAWIQDTGWYYPRYCVHFPAVSATQDGDYRLQFRGMPTATFDLYFDIEDEAARDAIRMAATQLSVTVTDASGAVLLEQQGHLEQRKGDLVKAWWLCQSSTLHEYYPDTGSTVRCDSKNAYILTVHVDASDHLAQGTDTMIFPVLRGGGCRPLVQKM